jgi:hypothetical protein
MAAKKTAKKTSGSASKEPKAPSKAAAKKAESAVKKAVNPSVVAEASRVVESVAAKKVAVKPSLDAIARAAYLNYRRRVELGLPGDAKGDWLEAERQANEVS